MIRDTSVAAYREIRDNGLLSKLRLEVYETLYHNGPLTQGEIFAWYFKKTRQQHSINPRYAELKNMGVIRTVGERPCKVTGVNCLVWDVTSKLPTKLVKTKRPTRKQLETENKKLKRQMRVLVKKYKELENGM